MIDPHRRSGRPIAILWALIAVALPVSLRRSPLMTGQPIQGQGFQALTGAPVLAFIPLFCVVVVCAVWTARWVWDRIKPMSWWSNGTGRRVNTRR